MEITNLSPVNSRPCYLLKMTNEKVTIMIDPMVDFSSFQSYIPFSVVPNGRFAQLPTESEGLSSVRQLDDYRFVDGMPEVKIAPLHMVKMHEVDAILVSHLTGLMALPFYTEGTGFQGVVYATEPTVQLGKLVMEEMIEYLERCTSDSNDDQWKEEQVWGQFMNPPTSDPRQWKQFYNTKNLLSALSNVRHVSFRQTVTVGGCVQVSAYGSGYSIGSLNWRIATENEKIGFLSHTSARQAHTNEVQWDHLRRMDHLVLTTMCLNRDNSPNEQVLKIGRAVVDTLRRGGSVLMPMCPTGTIYDMFEILISNMDSGQISPDVPIYFVSPVADSTLAFANIYAEYLSEQKQERVYIPEEPFTHTKLIANGRLKLYSNIHGQFSREFKTPCVMITGHPSLRVGDAVHFLEMWGNDSKNSILLTDPDYPVQAVYAPFQRLAIQVHYCPLDTRVDHSQLGKIIADLAPKQVLTSHEIKDSTEGFWNILMEMKKLGVDGEMKYHSNALRGLKIPQLDFYRRILEAAPMPLPPYPYDRIHELTYGLPFAINRAGSQHKVRVHPEVLRGVNVTGHGQAESIGMGAVRGYLSVYDNSYELNPVPETELHRVRKRPYGSLDLDLLQKRLSGFTIQYKIITGTDRSTTVETTYGTVWVDASKLRTKISATKKENRLRLADIVRHCLKSI